MWMIFLMWICWHADDADALGNADFRRFYEFKISDYVSIIVMNLFYKKSAKISVAKHLRYLRAIISAIDTLPPAN